MRGRRIWTWLRYKVNRERHRRAIEATHEAFDEQRRRGAIRLDTPRPDSLPPAAVTSGVAGAYAHGHPGVEFTTRCKRCNPR